MNDSDEAIVSSYLPNLQTSMLGSLEVRDHCRDSWTLRELHKTFSRLIHFKVRSNFSLEP